MCSNSCEENRNEYKSPRNKAKKSVSKPMREKGEEELIKFINGQNGMFGVEKLFQVDSNGVDGGRCMKGSDVKLFQ